MNQSIVLTADELTQLTGTKQPKRMCAWLLARGWAHEAPARRGDVPKVDRAYYAARMSGQQTAAAPQQRSRLRLDFMLNPQ